MVAQLKTYSKGIQVGQKKIFSLTEVQTKVVFKYLTTALQFFARRKMRYITFAKVKENRKN